MTTGGIGRTFGAIARQAAPDRLATVRGGGREPTRNTMTGAERQGVDDHAPSLRPLARRRGQERRNADGRRFTYRRLAGFAAAALAAAAALEPPADAQGVGTLGVSPTRVVFEGRTRSAEVLLINRGEAEATYRIYFENRRVAEDGQYEPADEPRPGELFADGLIRYAPRQATVPGGGVQTVRLLLRKPRDLPPGEYRTHLVLRSLPPANLGETIEDEELGEGEIRIRLIATYAVAIPVIVREGELTAEVRLSDLALEPGAGPEAPPVLSLRFNRSGERSTFGDVVATFVPDQGQAVEVGVVRGIAVHTPNETRTLLMTLSPPEGTALTGGRLHLVYRARPEEGDAVLAEAELPLP